MKISGLERLVVVAAAPIALAALCLPAAAQEAGKEQEVVKADDVIVVQGIRLANQRAIAAKRENVLVVDVVAQDDISSLPDFSVTEALQRIPGVSIVRADDRGNQTVIRGMNAEYNYVALDGAVLASTNQTSRAVFLDVVPSSVLSTAEVYKVFSPELDGQAIGGYVALRTRSAFDQDKAFFNVSADYGQFEYDDGPEEVEPSYRFNITYSTAFGQNDEFGLTVAATASRRDHYTYTPTIGGNRYDFYNPATGRNLSSQNPNDPLTNGWAVPHRNSQFLYRNNRQQTGGLAKLEYKPSDALHAFVSAFYYTGDDDARRDSMEWQRSSRTLAPTNWSEFSGTFTDQMEATPAYVIDYYKDELSSIQAGADLALSSRQELSFGAVKSAGDFVQPGNLYRFGFRTGAGDTRLAYSYDFGGDYGQHPVYTLLDPEPYADLNNYKSYYHRDYSFKNEEDVDQLFVDYAFNAGEGAEGWGVKSGLKLTSSDRRRDEYTAQYDIIDPNSYTLAMVSGPTGFVTPGTHTTAIPFVDPARAVAFFEANSGLFRANANNARDSLINDYVLSEDVSAAYAQAEFASERVTFVGGLRFERTEVSSSGYQRAVISGVETYPEINVDSAYEHWLPRATVAYRPNEDVIVRAGYSKSLGRANYRDLRPNRTLSWDGVQTIVSISGGNPALKPRESNNYDLSFERYLDDGLASIAVFHKQIKNEIVSQSVDTEGTYQGREVTFRETAPRNLNESELTGVELNIVLNSLDVLAAPLRGFGIAANYTWIASESSIAGFSGEPRELLTLPGQPEHTVNGSLFYTIGEFEARIAYNYRSEHLNQTNGREWFDRIWSDRETVDLQARYTVAGGTTLVAQAKNATGTYAGEENGFGGYFSRRDEGKSFWLGISYTR